MQGNFDPTVTDFLAKHRDISAVRVLTRWQKYKYFFLLALIVTCYLFRSKITFTVVNGLICLTYMGIIFYKLFIICLSVVKKLIRAVNTLDYPHDRLDVKILLEEDDTATIEAARAVDLPDCCHIMVIPHSLPKTKPKACNHGLREANGEFVVIYDAEDRPEPDQLKKAICAFKRVDGRVACLQAKLNYYNPRQNMLTKWFTLEYSAWFDLFLPGLQAMGVPIPLGGTSNHFRTDVLRELGGWDPFNVTEGCDLGVRSSMKKYSTQVLDSTTWEEANSRLGNWIRQRSRWVKGYIQTHLVYTRSVLKSTVKIGPLKFLSFCATIGGSALTFLLNPFYWIAGFVYVILQLLYYPDSPWQILYNKTTDPQGWVLDPWSVVSHIFFPIAIALAAANIIFVLVNLIAALKRRFYYLIPYALLSPLYWVLISIGAWKGFLQLLWNPFYWEKTVHGLTKEDISFGEKQPDDTSNKEEAEGAAADAGIAEEEKSPEDEGSRDEA